MQKIILLCLIITAAQNVQAQNTGINTASPGTSAVLEVYATDKGLLMPRLSTILMNAIYKPATGPAVYNTESASFCVYTGVARAKNITGANQPAETNYFTACVNNIYSNSSNTGTGTSAPAYRLHINSTAADSISTYYFKMNNSAANGGVHLKLSQFFEAASKAVIANCEERSRKQSGNST